MATRSSLKQMVFWPCVQHEIDHLNGIVFIDHLSRLKKDRARVKLRKLRAEKEKEAKNDKVAT